MSILGIMFAVLLVLALTLERVVSREVGVWERSRWNGGDRDRERVCERVEDWRMPGKIWLWDNGEGAIKRGSSLGLLLLLL